MYNETCEGLGDCKEKVRTLNISDIDWPGTRRSSSSIMKTRFFDTFGKDVTSSMIFSSALFSNVDLAARSTPVKKLK